MSHPSPSDDAAGGAGAPPTVPPAVSPAVVPAVVDAVAPTRAVARLTVEARRFWAGAVATALVAGLVGAVGVLLLERVMDLDLVLDDAGSAMAPTVLGSALAALVAAALLQALVVTTPRPGAFFGWILALATLVAVLLPLTGPSDRGAGIATAVLHLLVGVSIWSLLSGVLGWTVRRVLV
ncbi:hypothetical protein GC089_12720 [Cellulomonas sp. JZ18]|uniref:DUF6069 family protein n=1 Tax=Cellulomonas sp. JZ18 TaxID=2654191 RepID=UPI0012D47B60|nr:DUF6069 family protein [Cellulomonas sp. JZ18]QGQ19923.1 hypothetical protein GC089_12720 [Cellulomonas sp. JZ18]